MKPGEMGAGRQRTTTVEYSHIFVYMYVIVSQKCVTFSTKDLSLQSPWWRMIDFDPFVWWTNAFETCFLFASKMDTITTKEQKGEMMQCRQMWDFGEIFSFVTRRGRVSRMSRDVVFASRRSLQQCAGRKQSWLGWIDVFRHSRLFSD